MELAHTQAQDYKNEGERKRIEWGIDEGRKVGVLCVLLMSLCNHNRDETLDFLGLLQKITGMGVLTSFALMLTSQTSLGTTGTTGTTEATGTTKTTGAAGISNQSEPANRLMCLLIQKLIVETPRNSWTNATANSIRSDSESLSIISKFPLEKRVTYWRNSRIWFARRTWRSSNWKSSFLREET